MHLVGKEKPFMKTPIHPGEANGRSCPNGMNASRTLLHLSRRK
jgi:hypothetical protein